MVIFVLKKTKMALKKAWKAFENILPEFLVVILLVGFLLAILNPETISKIIGAESGWFGVILAGIIMSLGSKIVAILGLAGVIAIIAVILVIIVASVIIKKKSKKQN